MPGSSKKYMSRADALVLIRRFCAYQERCHQEVRSKLLELGIYGDDLEEMVAHLISENFLNEERFARSFARGKFRMKQWGKNRIVLELKKRDIAGYCIGKAMEEIDDQEYLLVLQFLLKKKAARLQQMGDDFAKKNKLAQYAIQRGYEPELVWECLKESDLED